MALAWLSYTRRASQRLGYIKFALHAAQSLGPGDGLAEAVRALVTTMVEVPSSEHFLSWLRSFSGRAKIDHEAVADDQGPLRCHIQALYVFETSSRSGWLSPKGVNEFLETVPSKIGFLASGDQIVEPGIVFYRGLLSPTEIDALTTPNGTNPLLLTPRQAFYLGHYLLAADGDFLIPFIGALYREFPFSSFDYLQAGRLMPDVIERVSETFRMVAYSADDRRKLNALDAAREQVLHDIEVHREKEGSGSKRDQMSVPRLEWLVDLGLLARGNGGEIQGSYRFSEGGRNVARSLATEYERQLTSGYPDQALSRLLDASYARAMGHIFKRAPVSGGLTPDGFLQLLLPTYRAIASPSGYCLLRPLSLAAVARAGEQQNEIYEYDEVVRALEETFKVQSDRVTYTVDRLTTDYQLRLTDDPS